MRDPGCNPSAPLSFTSAPFPWSWTRNEDIWEISPVLRRQNGGDARLLQSFCRRYKTLKKAFVVLTGLVFTAAGRPRAENVLKWRVFFLILGLFNLFTDVCGRCSLKLRLFCRNFSSICSFNCAFANSSLAFGYSLLGYLEKKGLNGSWREVPPAQITAN